MSRTEWAVKHVQGVAQQPDESTARSSLAAFTVRFETNHRNNFKPYLVTREVTEWTETD